MNFFYKILKHNIYYDWVDFEREKGM